ncbi:MAG: OsmC family peroxiredoxin [Acidimicrobiia bacterium]|nr:OsmC family peroxiredoxin [Acidimicrobiia bacterium]
MSEREHTYTVTCSWVGSTSDGYDTYDRTHTATAPPAQTVLHLSSDPAFRGDPTLLNPEQLLVLAASSCQLLSFLAVAARARIDVVSYTDDADGVMPEDPKPIRITRINLRPQITVRGNATDARLAHVCEVAHHECFIANSVTTEIVITPTFTFVD